MLHIRRGSEPTTAWAARGWPALWSWADRPEVPLLFWALHELSAAAQAEDIDAVEDLLTEAGLMLERIWTDPPDAHRRDAISISTGLWSEIQRGRGVTDLTQVALHARLLRNLVAPAGAQLPARSTLAVPPYLPPGERIKGGHLPLAGTAELRGRAQHEQFLLLIATILSNNGGHLVDYLSSDATPAGADRKRTGWDRPDGKPAGTRLGSIRTGGPEGGGDVFLRPGPCHTAIQRHLQIRPLVAVADQWSVDEIGWALAAAWLTDTTLIVEPAQVSRSHTTAWPVVADHPEEQVWRLPLAVFHPEQFFPEKGQQAVAPRLRPVPDR